MLRLRGGGRARDRSPPGHIPSRHWHHGAPAWLLEDWPELVQHLALERQPDERHDVPGSVGLRGRGPATGRGRDDQGGRAPLPHGGVHLAQPVSVPLAGRLRGSANALPGVRGHAPRAAVRQGGREHRVHSCVRLHPRPPALLAAARHRRPYLPGQEGGREVARRAPRRGCQGDQVDEERPGTRGALCLRRCQ